MKKILKFGAILSIAAPIAFAVSCGGSEDNHTDNIQPVDERTADIIRNSNTLEQSTWIDGVINANNDEYYIKNYPYTTSGVYWSNGESSSTYKRRGWTYYEKQFTPELYSKEVITRDFSFMNEDLSNEIHTFISNVFKYDEDMATLALSPEYTHMNSNAQVGQEKKIIIFDKTIKGEAGPRGLYSQVQLMTTNSADISTNRKTNAEAAFFKAPQVGFNPSFIANHAKDIAGTDVLWDAVKTNTNYASYNAKYNNEAHKDNNYLALKLLAGNLDLTTSQLYEVVSASFMELSAIKKQELVNQLVAKNYKVILHGEMHGGMDNISTTLLKPSILDNVHSIYSGGASMHAALEKTMEFSGKYESSPTIHSSLNPGSFAASNNFAIIEYIKIKYGLLKRLDTALKNTSFKMKFKDKVWMSFGDKSISDAYITDFEESFYTTNEINHLMVTEKRADQPRFFRGALEWTPTPQQYVTNVLKEDESILDTPIYDWSAS